MSIRYSLVWMIPLIFGTGCDGGQKPEETASGTNTSADSIGFSQLPSVASVKSASSASNSVASGSSKVTVVFFGTSLTAGYGLDPAIAFPQLIEVMAAENGTPIIAVNAGLSGETSAGAARRIGWVMKQPADVVVIETGGNDALRALNADSLKTNLNAIVAEVRRAQPGARILLAVMEAPPNLGRAYTSKFRQAYEGVAEAQGVALLPFLLDGVAGRDELNQADGVHPNEKGEKVVAGNVWRALRPVVEEAYRGKNSG